VRGDGRDFINRTSFSCYYYTPYTSPIYFSAYEARSCVCDEPPLGRACVRLSPAAPGNGGDLALPPARSSRSPAARPPAPPRGGGHMDLGLLRAHGRTAADLEEGLDLDTAD
jgi:hypothetical protein